MVDPLGGSYYVESLTTEYEKRIFEILEEVEKSGGTIRLIQEGWFQRHIADFAYETALRKQSGDKPVIGVNRFVDAPRSMPSMYTPMTRNHGERQIARTQRVRAERDPAEISIPHGKAGLGGAGRPRRTSCRSPSKRSRTGRPWARSSTA